MQKTQSEPYRGPIGIARDSEWLTAEDLPRGRDVKVKVEDVRKRKNVKYKGPDDPNPKKIVISLKFVGKERELGLNATNRKAMARMFGAGDTGAWIGKTVALYITQVSAFGEVKDCVRIRDTGARAATAAEEFLHDEPEDVLPTNGAALASDDAGEVGDGESLFGKDEPAPGVTGDAKADFAVESQR